jgi:hypothetical protein
MKSLYPAACLLSHGALAQYLEPPPTATDPTTIDDCSYWHIATSGETCASIAATYGLTLQQFELYVGHFIINYHDILERWKLTICRILL